MRKLPIMSREHLQSVFERLTASERESLVGEDLDEQAAERAHAQAEVEAERVMLGLAPATPRAA